MSNIGFIGLGIMGKPMALNLIKGGHTLFLNSRSGVSKELTDAGGKACASAKEVAQKSDIIITMVPETPDVEKVLFGADGVATGLTKGKTVIDMSSISPMGTKVFAKRINDLSCEYVDAPVSGGEVGAKNAALTLMPCALLTDEPVTLRNLPRLADVDGFGHLLSQVGASKPQHDRARAGLRPNRRRTVIAATGGYSEPLLGCDRNATAVVEQGIDDGGKAVRIIGVFGAVNSGDQIGRTLWHWSRPP